MLLSVRDGKTGKRMATVGIERDEGGVRLRQVVGFANARVAPEIKALAQRCARLIEEQLAPGLQRVYGLPASSGDQELREI